MCDRSSSTGPIQGQMCKPAPPKGDRIMQCAGPVRHKALIKVSGSADTAYLPCAGAVPLWIRLATCWQLHTPSTPTACLMRLCSPALPPAHCRLQQHLRCVQRSSWFQCRARHCSEAGGHAVAAALSLPQVLAPPGAASGALALAAAPCSACDAVTAAPADSARQAAAAKAHVLAGATGAQPAPVPWHPCP